MRGAVVQSRERAAHRPGVERPAGEDVGGERRVREHHPAEADHRRAAAVRRPPARRSGSQSCRYEYAPPTTVSAGCACGELGGGGELAGHADERVLGRVVAVRRREVRRPLHVRVVVRAAGGDAHEPDAELGEGRAERVRLGEVDAEPGAVAAERVAGTGRRPPGRPGRRRRRRTARRSNADSRTAIASPGARGADAGDDGAEEARAAGEVAAVAAGPVARAEQLVEEVAVAVLHVDEVEAGVGREHRPRST